MIKANKVARPAYKKDLKNCGAAEVNASMKLAKR